MIIQNRSVVSATMATSVRMGSVQKVTASIQPKLYDRKRSAINRWMPVNTWSLVEIQALTMSGGWLRRIRYDEVGLDLPAVVWDGYMLKIRQGSEGVPVTYDKGSLRLQRRGEVAVY